MVSRYFSLPSHPSIWDLLAQQYVLLPTRLFEAQQIATDIMCHYLALLQHFAMKHWGQKGGNRKHRLFQASAACFCRIRKSVWFGITQLQRTEQLKTHGTRQPRTEDGQSGVGKAECRPITVKPHSSHNQTLQHRQDICLEKKSKKKKEGKNMTNIAGYNSSYSHQSWTLKCSLTEQSISFMGIYIVNLSHILLCRKHMFLYFSSQEAKGMSNLFDISPQFSLWACCAN